MGILGFIKVFKQTSLFFLRLQENMLTLRLSLYLKRNKKYLKQSKGCSLKFDSNEQLKKERLNNELRIILKKNQNNPDLLLDYLTKQNVKIFKLKDAQKVLSHFGEEPGLIPALSGVKALIFNLLLFKNISFTTKPMFILEDNDVDIYFLIQQFHKWYFMQNEFLGFDEKSQSLLRQVNRGNEDLIIKKLKPEEVVALKHAIARDVDSISFVEKYARETAGSKKALDKIKNGLGANI